MPKLFGTVRRALPAAQAEAASVEARLGRYAEQYVIPIMPDAAALAEEGTYWKACNPTLGTAIADNIQTSFSATKGILCVVNTDSAGGKSIYPDYLKLIPAVAPASATSTEIAIAIDTVNRYSSGATNLTPVNANSATTATSVATVCRFGAVTFAAASAARYLARSKIFHAIEVVGSEFVILFNRPVGDCLALNGTAPVRIGCSVGPLVIGPGNHSMCVHTWRPANAVTAPTYEVEFGWWER
jgi:hypothetical protein